MQQQLAINPCVCGISNAECPVHPISFLAPSDCVGPRTPGGGKEYVIYIAPDFNTPMKLVDDI